MTAIEVALLARRTEIAQACAACGRDPADVSLLAVSKGQPAAAVAQAWAAGQRRFGENYVQEALDKIAALEGLDAEWHFIGPLQSNKTARVAEHFAWVHSVDRLRLAERLSAQRPPQLPPLNICVQVNISGEPSKSGCAPEQAAALCQGIAALPRLRLRGLMAIPAPSAPGTDPRAPFRALRRLLESLRAQGLALDTLSAGMSDDFAAAIAEGATLVRIGTGIFGARSR